MSHAMDHNARAILYFSMKMHFSCFTAQRKLVIQILLQHSAFIVAVGYGYKT